MSWTGPEERFRAGKTFLKKVKIMLDILWVIVYYIEVGESRTQYGEVA